MIFINTFLYVYVIVLLSQWSITAYSKVIEDWDSAKSEVWLTVSSLIGRNKQTQVPYERQLEINWRNAPKDTGNDWVGLFDEEPDDEKIKSLGRKAAIDSIFLKGSINGSYRTDTQFPHHVFTKEKLNSSCLTYWSALISNKEITAKNCIKNNPFWMEENLDSIRYKPLINLMIPGTHNAGSYDIYRPEKENILRKYALCQDENVWNQLIYGNRYLDLRISYDNVKNRTEKLWIVHGPVRMKQSLESIILQVKDFIEIAPKEIVIIDIHKFEKGFDEKDESHEIVRIRHHSVIALLKRHLGNYIASANYSHPNTTVNDLLLFDKRIIVGYNTNGHIQNEYLFPGVKHLWANTDKVNKLEEFFNTTMCTRERNSLRSAMAELTASNLGILRDRYKGLRTMAQSVNYEITKWFINRWDQCTNIVATDYFLGNNIIEIAIKRNQI